VAVKKDDLTIIEGIGPKMALILHSAGVHRFDQLATINENNLRELLGRAGIGRVDSSTWREQAWLAAIGELEALSTLQEQFKGGKEVQDGRRGS
jgi:large subunit ribosomal protein L17